MIEHRGVILIGRHEPLTDANRAMRVFTQPYRERAERAWRGRWPDRVEAWHTWDVQAMIGSFGAWHSVDFLCFDGFGRTHAPVLTERLRYIPILDQIDPMAVPDNPPVLHEHWRLLPTDGQPGAEHAYRQGWVERLRTLEARLERMGAFDHPGAGTRDGWVGALAHYGLTVREDGHGRFHLDPIQVEARAL